MQWDVIWSRARADLVITKPRGEEDVLLWEHSARVARNARLIAQLPEPAAGGVDEAATVLAGLYHDAGWAVRLRRGEIQSGDIFVRAMHEDHREEGAAMLSAALAKLVPSETMNRATHAIRAMADKGTDRIEALVVMDADNLDEFGVIALWPMVRRGLVDGKAVQAVIETWRARKEYRFWEARLRDSFRFSAARDVARQRLEQMDELMSRLAQQQRGEDLAQRLGAGVPDAPPLG